MRRQYTDIKGHHLNTSSQQSFFATCSKGLEQLLLDELESFGATDLKATVAGVAFSGELTTAYRACLWSRLANRILLPLANFPAEDADALYAGVQSIDWLDHLRSTGTLIIDFNGSSRAINNTHFGALRVKDAIVDQIRQHTGQRPSIERDRPDIRVHCFLNRQHAQISIDLSGDSLHRRGYRLKGGEAPLKENLAAAILLRCGWDIAGKQGLPLIDPMCGSGTLLIEAAMMALDWAPGLHRKYYGFDHWLGHQPAVWKELMLEARDRQKQQLASGNLEIHGYDAQPKAVSIARENIARAGLENHIRVSQRELTDLKPLTHLPNKQPGLLVTNPPYGERLSEVPVIVYLYRYLGEGLRKHFADWNVGVFTGNPELGKAVGLRSQKQYKFFNGAIPSKLLLFHVAEEHIMTEYKKGNTASGADAGADQSTEKPEVTTQQPAIALNEAGQMFANRLKKNLKQIDKWARKNDIHCYRVYDADMPEFAVAVDRYEDRVLVQEYAPPASVDAVKAVERLEQVIAAVPGVMDVPSNKVVLKQRKRQSGAGQYQKLDNQKDMFEVVEGDARLLVNLNDYLDTGLFLDHRPIRQKIAEWANGKHFLNLFCYTGAATIQAAVGGARRTLSVDLSNTYLEWLQKNLAVNGLSEQLNKTLHADCCVWLTEAVRDERNRFDLIFMDPPTFSNSKRMNDVLDIQRDHVDLIRKAVALLNPNGTLVFSNNLRNFKMDLEALADLSIENYTQPSIDKDFERNKKIHNCWLISS